MILMMKKLLEHFTKKYFKKTNKKKFGIKNIVKRKGDKLYFKWNGYNNSFDSWLDKKDIV